MDPEEAYENFDLKPPRQGPDPVLIGLAAALVILLASAGYLVWNNGVVKREASDLKEQIASLTQQLAEKDEDMRGLIADHNAELDRVNDDWKGRFDTYQEEQAAKLQKSYEMIAQIVNNSSETLHHMKTLENKVKSGKQLHEEEIEQLKAVGQGLAYLHSQYEKPLYEFQELDTFLSKQLQVQVDRPDDKVKLFKELFSKKYREAKDAEWAAYYQDRGRISGVKTARDRVATAYARAQSQMGAIKLDADQYLATLDDIIEGKEANAELLESFFDISNEVLKVHQSVMDVSDDTPVRSGTTVNP